MEQSVFSVGEKAEAVDSVGCWAPCTVKEVRDGQYLVGFHGWTSKWDLQVKPDEIRTVSQQEMIERQRGPKSKDVQVSSLHLERGDVITIIADNRQREAEVVTIDPIRNNVIVEIEGEIRTVDATEIGEKDEVTPPLQFKPKKQKVATKKRSHPPTVMDSDTTTRRNPVPVVMKEDLLLPSAPGADRYVSVGDMCTFQNMFPVIVMSLFTLGEVVYAKCAICKLNSDIVVDTYEGAEFRCLASDLCKAACRANSKISKLIAATVAEQKGCIQSSSIDNSCNTEYMQVLRKVRICRQIGNDIQNMLTGKSFKRTFEYVLHKFDFNIFGLSSSNNYDVTFLLEDGFSFLDNLFFHRWDVCCHISDPTSKFNFIRSVRIKSTIHSLSVALVKAQSAACLSDNYREMAVKGLLAIQSELHPTVACVQDK